MYLGAQRVEDPSGKCPISLHYYVHSSRGVDPESLRDVQWVSESEPGQLRYHRTPGRAGGRGVRSYLDVSGPDGAPMDEIKKALDALREHVASGGRGAMEWRTLGARFYARGPFDVIETLREFDALAGALIEFAADAFNAPAPPRALTVYRRREGETTVFSWAPESRKIVDEQGAAREQIVPARVSVNDDTLSAFEHLHGSFLPHVLDALLPGGRKQLVALGGASVVDAATNETLWFSEEP